MTGLRVVAFDLSIAATGIAGTHNHRGERRPYCRTAHTARTVPDGIDHKRIKAVLVDVATACRCQPDICALEWLPAVTRVDPTTGRTIGKGEATLRSAELHGVVTQWLFSKGIRYVYVKPTYVQMWATGNGRSTKRAVREAITARYASALTTQIEDDNAADATSLLGLTTHAYGEPLIETLNPNHLRALKGVQWPTLGEVARG